MEISLAPETLFEIGSIQVTNTLFTTFVILVLMSLFIFYMNRKFTYDNPGKFQIVMEMFVGGLYSLVKNILGRKKAKVLFPFLFTFFFFIIFSNWFGLLPITPSIGLESHKTETEVEAAEDHDYKKTKAEDDHNREEYSTDPENHLSDAELYYEGNSNYSEKSKDSETSEHEDHSHEVSLGNCINTKHCYLTTQGVKMFEHSTHVLRAPTSDISAGLALAIVSVIVTNALGFYYVGVGYFKKYFNFKGPIDFFVGILEIVSEFGKIVSFSFRLFGNIFAGEVLITVITSISFGLATLPFLGLEIFVGFIQALVFFMLTTVFIGLSVSHDH